MLAHILLTRFNLPTPGVERSYREKSGWLTDRVALFQRFCLPSVTAQAGDARFSWLVYFDPDSPDWLVKKADRWAASTPMQPLYRASVSRSMLLKDIAAHSDAECSRLITTNLDNDDCLARDFVHRVQKAATPTGRHAIFLGDGLIRSGDRLYRHHDRHNAFCSVSEDFGPDAMTAWSTWHNLLPREMPCVVAQGGPGWLQVVHGRNVSNRARGRLVSPQAFRTLFPGALDDVTEPTRTQVLVDTYANRGLRGCAENARSAAKAIIMAGAGTAGVERVRTRLRQWSDAARLADR